MIPMIIKATEPHTKQRFGFAATSFVRMWGHGAMKDPRIVEFCEVWSHRNENAPTDNSIDQYFYYEFKSWRGY